MKKINQWSRALPGVVVVLLAVTALAAVGDLEVAAPPRFGSGLSVKFPEVRKITTGKDIGLPTAEAVIASGTVSGIDVRLAVTGKANKFDAMRVDTSGKGRFSKAPVLRMRTLSSKPERYIAAIGPVRMMFAKDGQSIPATVTGRFFGINGKYSMYLQFIVTAQGSCAFGEATRKVRIIDASGDMTFGEARTGKTTPGRFVRVLVADENGKFQFQFSRITLGTEMGQPIQVGGKWYVLKVGGMKVSAEALTCPMGKIVCGSKKWQLQLTSKKYKIIVRGGAKPVEVPADTYKLMRCCSLCTGPSKVAVLNSSPATPVKVVAGETLSLPTNLPLKVTILATVGKGKVTFALKQTDAAGFRASVVNQLGARPRPPSIDVVDQKGTIVHTAKLENG